MSRSLWCCSRRPNALDMGASLTHEDVIEHGSQNAAPITMAEVIRERKKKCSSTGGLSTLRRRLGVVRRARTCSSQDRDCEHARHIRTIVSQWRPAEVAALHEEYETLHALRDLTTQAELARCPAGTLHADLAALYADRFCSEACLVWRGTTFAVHRSILSARCPYLRDVLNSYPGNNARIVLEGLPYSMTSTDLDNVLTIIYAGEEGLRLVDSQSSHNDDSLDNCSRQPDIDILQTDQVHNGRPNSIWRNGNNNSASAAHTNARIFAEQLGVAPGRLAQNLARLLHDGTHADAALVFSSEAAHGFRSKLELPCHRAVLAARSPFFRSVIRRLLASSPSVGACRNNWGSSNILRIAVDENVLPRRLARALLHAAYTDQLDLSLISRNNVPAGVHHVSSNSQNFGGCRQLEDACELYETARFLEMAIVSQRCEDAIIETLSAETLPHILRWSSQEHASKWVYRQAMRYLREEFVSLCCTSNPCLLDREHMANALHSNYLQASEAQALRALIRWGERTLTSWSGNVASPGSSGDVARGKRGARRAIATALRNHIAPLVPLIRMEHVYPTHALHQAIRRGVLGDNYANIPSVSPDAWLGRPPHKPARLFMPYYDEIKALLEDQNVSEAEVMQLRRVRFPQQIPDALYMVSQNELCRDEKAAASGVGGMLWSLRNRLCELCASARPLPPHAALRARTQLALRATRERDLPDTLARHLAPESPPNLSDDENNGGNRPTVPLELDVCMPSSSHQATLNDQRYGIGGTLSVRVPDVAACVTTAATSNAAASSTTPTTSNAASASSHAGLFNANTHLLSAPYCRAIFTPWRDMTGGVMQLDLGDGATHAPRPGSRASRVRRSTGGVAGSSTSSVAASSQQQSAAMTHHLPTTPQSPLAHSAAYLSYHHQTSNPSERYNSLADQFGQQGPSYGSSRVRNVSARNTSTFDEMSSKSSTLERLNRLQISRESLDRIAGDDISNTSYNIQPPGGSAVDRNSPCMFDERHQRRVRNRGYDLINREISYAAACSSLGREQQRRKRDEAVTLSQRRDVASLRRPASVGREAATTQAMWTPLGTQTLSRRDFSGHRSLQPDYNSPHYGKTRSPASSRGHSPASQS